MITVEEDGNAFMSQEKLEERVRLVFRKFVAKCVKNENLKVLYLKDNINENG